MYINDNADTVDLSITLPISSKAQSQSQSIKNQAIQYLFIKALKTTRHHVVGIAQLGNM